MTTWTQKPISIFNIRHLGGGKEIDNIVTLLLYWALLILCIYIYRSNIDDVYNWFEEYCSMLDLILKWDVLSLTIISKLTKERCQAQPVQLLDVTSSQLTSRMQLKELHFWRYMLQLTTIHRPLQPNLRKSVAQRLPVAVQVKTGNILSKDGQTTKLPQIYMELT